MIKVNYDSTTGEIEGFYPDFIDYSRGVPEPNIEIDEATHQDCINNPGRRRVDLTTKTIIEYTPPAPTPEELQKQKLANLDAEYQPRFKALAESVGLATLDGNQFNIDSIKADYAALKAEYNTKWEAIING